MLKIVPTKLNPIQKLLASPFEAVCPELSKWKVLQACPNLTKDCFMSTKNRLGFNCVADSLDVRTNHIDFKFTTHSGREIKHYKPNLADMVDFYNTRGFTLERDLPIHDEPSPNMERIALYGLLDKKWFNGSLFTHVARQNPETGSWISKMGRTGHLIKHGLDDLAADSGFGTVLAVMSKGKD
ncbi:MAG: hypothetical protein VKJ06_07970 [Vampirovibrionales bacterium]|nr:hypothetical protein [Vampirovibrionales bacterium]